MSLIQTCHTNVRFNKFQWNIHKSTKKSSNAFQNLHHNKYFSYNHHNIMVNDYNPNLIACMFPTLFPFGIDAFEMNNRPMKVSLQIHMKHLRNLEENHYPFSKHHLFPFFIFTIIQQKQKCLRAKLTIIKHK